MHPDLYSDPKQLEEMREALEKRRLAQQQANAAVSQPSASSSAESPPSFASHMATRSFVPPSLFTEASATTARRFFWSQALKFRPSATPSAPQTTSRKNTKRDDRGEQRMVETPQGNVPMVEIEIVDAPPDYHKKSVKKDKPFFQPSMDPNWDDY